jgi:hypothetical protein
VSEGLPIWQQDLATALPIVVPGLAALACCVLLMRQRQGDERIWWQDYTLLQAGGLGMACLLARAGGVSAALAAVPLAYGLEGALHQLALPDWRRRGVALVAVVVALVPTAPLTVMALVPHAAPRAAGPTPTLVAACNVAQGAATLAHAPKGLVLAPLDLGPELLLATPQAVLASGHHRGARGMHAALAAFMAPPAQAVAMLHAERVDTIALCPGGAEVALYARTAPQGLAAALVAGKAPAWAHPLPPASANSALRVWRVTP